MNIGRKALIDTLTMLHGRRQPRSEFSMITWRDRLGDSLKRRLTPPSL